MCLSFGPSTNPRREPCHLEPAIPLPPSAATCGSTRASAATRGAPKWHDPQGQHEKRLGPAWTGKGPPPPGFLRERDAQALLEAILVDARRGQLRQEHTGLTFAGVAEERFERGRFERDWSASTQVDYRSVLDAHLLPKFGPDRLEAITAEQVEVTETL